MPSCERWNLSAAQEGRFRVEAYIDSGDEAINKSLFDELHAEAAMWEDKAGVPLKWERLDDKRASRIHTMHDPADLNDDAAREELRSWAVRAILGMYDAMNEHLRARARQLRELARTQNADEPQAPPRDAATVILSTGADTSPS